MKSLTVRLPEHLVADIDAESRGRGLSRSDVVRERLQGHPLAVRRRTSSLQAIADVIGSIEHLPADVSAATKRYLRVTGYGRKRHR